MKKIDTYELAIYLLKQGECLVSASFGDKVNYYYLRNNKISLRNENLKAFLSLEEFKEAFNNGKFYLYENEEEIEIDQNDKYWRQ